MDLNRITTLANKIYDSKWINLNLFFPEVLAIGNGKTESTAIAQNTLQLLSLTDKEVDSEEVTEAINNLKEYSADFSENKKDSTGTTWAGIEHLFTSIEGLNFSSLPFEKKNGQIISKESNESGKQLSLEFLVDGDASALQFYNHWKSSLLTEKVEKTNNIFTMRDSIKANANPSAEDTASLPEGTLILNYIKATRDNTGSIKMSPTGLLVIAGLVPVSVETFSKVGPGLAATSNIETLKIKCIYSLGFLKTGTSAIWLA